MIENKHGEAIDAVLTARVDLRGDYARATVEVSDTCTTIQLARMVKAIDDEAVALSKERGVEKEFSGAMIRLALIDALSKGLDRGEGGGHVG